MVSANLRVVEPEKSLDALAGAIRAAHDEVRRNSLQMAERAVEAGRLLTKAKANPAIPRGGWERWVEEVARIPYQTAQRYCQLYNAILKRTISIQNIAEEGQIAALRSVAVDNHRAIGTGENEWFTPPEYIEAARTVMGGIDLDPASHIEAQKFIKAKKYYTMETDGLTKQWNGKVWLNPPYAKVDIPLFIDKLLAEYAARRTTEAILLTHNYTDTGWFHAAEPEAALICFTRGRIAFQDPDGDRSNPTQGQAFFYYGSNGNAFRREFSKYGFIR